MACEENYSDTILAVCKEVAFRENLQAVLIRSAKKAGVVAMTTVAGGLLGGRLGMALGSALGGSLASYLTTSDLQSVVEIIQNGMTPEQRRQFVNQIATLFKGIKLSDVASVMMLLTKSSDLKMAVISQMAYYFNKELGMSVV